MQRRPSVSRRAWAVRVSDRDSEPPCAGSEVLLFPARIDDAVMKISDERPALVWLSRCALGSFLFAAVLLGGCAGSRDRVPAQGREGSLSAQGAGVPEREAELRKLLDSLREEAGAPGAVLGVLAGDDPPILVASGEADREAHRRMAPGDPYFLGSITKTYTAVTVLRLAEEGHLSLDDTLDRFLPSFPEGSKITLRHLLGHTSGLKDFYLYLYLRPDREEMIAFVTKRWSQEELLALSGRFGRYFDPGTDWDYSSTNYFLLGVVVERASGLPLPEAYRRYIYEPLGLRRTWLHQHEEARAPVPTGYMGKVESWKHSEMFGELGATTVLDRSSAELAAGGLVAPAEEALRFLRAMFAGELLSSASLEAMMQFRSTPPLGGDSKAAPPGSRPDGYGLGLIRMERPGFTLLGHGGLYNGHTSGLWHLPDHGLTIALYFNRGFIDQRAVLDRLLPILDRMRIDA